MSTRISPQTKALRTAGNISYIIGTAFLIAALIFNVMPPQTTQAAQDSGAIWTTQTTCATPADQDANSFAIGETVHIRGRGFLPNYTYNFQITGNPGGSSGDPNIVVASGSTTTDGTGYFCVAAYTVQPDDWGEYTVDVSDPTGGGRTKNDNYRVKEQWTSTPVNTATNTPTNTPTNTLEPTFTNTPTNTPTNTLEPTATNTTEPTATNTTEPTATNTPETPPTDTPETPPTNTPETPPTNTPETPPTNTPETPPTETPVPPTEIPPTVVPPTDTQVPPTEVATATQPAEPTAEVTQEQPTTPATLAPPPDSPPSVLIPVTGIDLSANGLMGNLQTLFTNLGLSLLGLGLVLKGMARRIG